MSQFNQNDLATLMSQPVNREILFLDKSVLPEGEITIDAVLSLYRQSDKGMMGINQLVTLLVSAEQLNDLLQNNKPLASLVLRDDTDLASFHLDIDETMRTFMHTGHGELKGFDSDHDVIVSELDQTLLKDWATQIQSEINAWRESAMLADAQIEFYQSE